MKMLSKQIILKPLSTWISILKQDYLDLFLKKRTREIPPLRLMFDGPADYEVFKKNGLEYLKYYIELCGLTPDSKILDVGSGIGRKTIPLTEYLNQEGEYWGIELSRVGVEWCQKQISKKHPNFHFQVIDVYNRHFNPEGSQQASKFIFPFTDKSFDFVILGSIFTHLLPEDLCNYLKQVERVLKPGKKCLITYFLLNDESLRLIEGNRSTLEFIHQIGNFRTTNLEDPECAIAYEEKYILDLYKKFGLSAQKPICYGSWCERNNYLSYQDIIIAEKLNQ